MRAVASNLPFLDWAPAFAGEAQLCGIGKLAQLRQQRGRRRGFGFLLGAAFRLGLGVSS